MSYLLMTGATGLVGRYVLRDLLTAGERVAVLVRDDKRADAQARMDSVLRHFEELAGHALPRPVIIRGDLCKARAGLDAHQLRWIATNCERVLHSAASMTFRKDGRGEPFRTNVEGTRTLLELCRECGIRDFHHVSTAFICGLRTGRILESEVDLGQPLGNVYEESKLRAEKMIRAADWLERVTVYRPSSVVGDSRTGYVTNFHGFYLPLQLAHLMASQIRVADMNERFLSTLGLTGDEGKNFVPVDWVASAIAHVLSHEELHERTYHLASPTPVPVAAMQQVIQSAIEQFHPHPLRDVSAPVNMGSYEALFQQYMQVYESHWRNDPTFDLTNTARAMPHLPCPTLDDDMLMRIARYPVERNFNLWRQDDAERATASKDGTPFAASGHFRRLITAAESLPDAHGEQIGLQINGDGGGQWRLLLQNERLAGAEPGLPPGDSMLLYLSAATFRSLVQGQMTIEHSLDAGRILVENPGMREALLVPLLRQLIAA